MTHHKASYIFGFMLLNLLLLNPKAYSQITFTVNSQNGYAITCSNPTLYLSATSNYSAPVTYTWLSSQATIGTGASQAITAPGVYTVLAASGSQSTMALFTVILDNAPPGVSISAPTTTLSCSIPTVQLQAGSNVAGVSYTWTWPAGTIQGSVFTASANFSAPNNTVLANYTVTAISNANGCTSTVVSTVYQNIALPIPVITSSNGVLTCLSPSITLANQSTTGIVPGTFFISQPIIGLLWSGPEGTKSLSSTYVASTPGTYTMQVKDQNNGCTASKTITITDNRVYPAFLSQPVYVLNCPIGSVDLIPVLSSSVNITSFQWQIPAGANVTGLNSPMLTTDSPGYYTVTVTNNFGCTSQATMAVYACVGLDEQSRMAGQFNLYPNPVKDKLTLHYNGTSQHLKFKIQNIVGQTICEETNVRDKQEIDLNGFARGIYFMMIRDDSGQQTFRLIKE